MRQINVYVDESGIIAKTIGQEKNYFIITMLFVAEAEGKVKSIFKDERLKIIKRSEKLLKELLTEKEVKGSELSEHKKSSIYQKIATKCNGEMELGIILLNNNEASGKP